MKKVHLILTGCALSVAMSSAFAVTTVTTTTHTTHTTHCPLVKAHHTGTCHTWARGSHMWFMGGTVARYGYLTPEQKTWLAVPAGATPGARGVCWSNIMEGKIKLTVPNYGKVMMTPNNPLVVFAVPQQGFYAKYCGKNSGGGFPLNPFKLIMKPFGGGKSSDNTVGTGAPVRLICKFY